MAVLCVMKQHQRQLLTANTAGTMAAPWQHHGSTMAVLGSMRQHQRQLLTANTAGTARPHGSG